MGELETGGVGNAVEGKVFKLRLFIVKPILCAVVRESTLHVFRNFSCKSLFLSAKGHFFNYSFKTSLLQYIYGGHKVIIMDTVLRRKSPAKASLTTRCPEVHTAAEKASVLVKKENQGKIVDLYQILINACEKEMVKLEIPETLVRDEETQGLVCLYTDRDGIVRMTSGENAERHFYFLCRDRRRASQNSNPHGHHFPKYICFENSKAACTLDTTSELKGYLAGDWQRVQRYIVGEGFRARKTMVWWRETRKTKVYSVCSRVGCPGKRGAEGVATTNSSKVTSAASTTPCPHSFDKPSFDAYLDYTYVASISNLPSCDIRKESSPPQVAEEVSPTLRHLLSVYSLTAIEHLQEFVYSLQKSQDGCWRVLNCARAKVSALKDGLFARRSMSHRKTRSIYELSSKLFSAEQHNRTSSFVLPKINVKEAEVDHTPMLRQASGCPHMMKSRQGSPADRDVLISRYIGNLAGKLDTLREQARVQKQVNEHKNIMKFKHHPPGFLENVISKVYDSVMKDPKLTRYYRQRDQIREQVESAVKHVIVNGISKARLRDVHSHLYITDAIFDRYVSNFLTALRSEEVKPDEIKAAEAYFEGFREDVVTVPFEEIEEVM